MNYILRVRRDLRKGLRLTGPQGNHWIEHRKIEWHINLAYTKPLLWREHLDTFFNLFTKEEQAVADAKTYSIALICKWLHSKKGCSYKVIYRALINEINRSGLEVNKQVLNTANE